MALPQCRSIFTHTKETGHLETRQPADGFVWVIAVQHFGISQQLHTAEANFQFSETCHYRKTINSKLWDEIDGPDPRLVDDSSVDLRGGDVGMAEELGDDVDVRSR